MRYTWDAAKNATNIAKHHIDFADAEALFDGPLIVAPDRRKAYGEERSIAIGISAGIVFTIVYTDRGDERRIISFRRASKKERRTFLAALQI